MEDNNGSRDLPVEYEEIPEQNLTIYTSKQVALKTKTISELNEGREYRKQLAASMISGNYKDGVEVGSVPGIKKMVFKEGIQYIRDAFHLGLGQSRSYTKEPTIEVDGKTIQHYTVTSDTPIVNLITNQIIAVGRGTCSTLEPKYRYRGNERVCPKCKESTIMVGKSEWGGGWYCNKNKGGCGEKFPENHAEITNQVVGKVENLNPVEVLDTVTAMSIKRGTGRSVLDVTGMSLYCTSGYEDKGRDHHNSQTADNMAENAKSEKYQKDPPEKKKEEKKSGKSFNDLKSEFENEMFLHLPNQDIVEDWFLGQQKNHDEKKYGPKLTNPMEIKTEKQLGMFKGKFRKEFGEPQRDLLPEADINDQ